MTTPPDDTDLVRLFDDAVSDVHPAVGSAAPGSGPLPPNRDLSATRSLSLSKGQSPLPEPVNPLPEPVEGAASALQKAHPVRAAAVGLPVCAAQRVPV